MLRKDRVLTFSIAISFKHLFAEDLGMNADPKRPYQRKELPSNLGLTRLVSVTYIIRLSLYN